jgi:hypothetical protein
LEKALKLEPIQPRYLKYRSHYRVYLMFFFAVSFFVFSFWAYRLYQQPWESLYQEYPVEMIISLFYFGAFSASYIFWLRSRLNQSVQVYPTHLSIHKGKEFQEIHYEDIESISIVCWSLFYLKMKNGYKHYFSSSLERVDYIWEGLQRARPELFSYEEFENFRLNLVQYDHHQKRKEWFFRHKFVDIINWIFLPAMFLCSAYMVQSQEVIIHQQGLYFFRLFMYSLLILLITAFLYSMVLKKLVFDRKIIEQIEHAPGDKLRDLEFEGVVVQRSKIFQMVTACFVFFFVIKTDMNLFSVTKVRGDLSYFKIKGDKALLVDNRFNCLNCRFQITDGDMVVFGRGYVGQVLAKEGELVGEISQDTSGRMIASQNVQEVPAGQVAVKSANGKDIVFVKVSDLIGKIQK